MPNPLPTLPGGSEINDLAQLLQIANPLFGTGRSAGSETQTTTPDPTALSQQDEVMKQIMASINGPTIDDMVGNILERARQAFGDARISPNAGGVRSYSDTVMQQLQHEAMARAVGEAAKAKLDATQQGLSTAAGLNAARLKATGTQTTTKTGKVGASPLGQVTGAASLAALAYNQFKKLKKPTPNSPYDPNVSGAEGIDASVGQAYSDAGGGITSVEAGTGGTGIIEAPASGGASVFAAPPPSQPEATPLPENTIDFAPSAAELAPIGEVPVADSMATALEQGTPLAEGLPAEAIDLSAIGEQPVAESLAAATEQGTPAASAAPVETAAGAGAAGVVVSDPRSIAEILSSQGIPEGSAMPAAVLPGAEMPPAPSPEAVYGGEAGAPTPIDSTQVQDIIPQDTFPIENHQELTDAVNQLLPEVSGESASAGATAGGAAAVGETGTAAAELTATYGGMDAGAVSALDLSATSGAEAAGSGIGAAFGELGSLAGPVGIFAGLAAGNIIGGMFDNSGGDNQTWADWINSTYGSGAGTEYRGLQQEMLSLQTNYSEGGSSIFAPDELYARALEMGKPENYDKFQDVLGPGQSWDEYMAELENAANLQRSYQGQ